VLIITIRRVVLLSIIVSYILIVFGGYVASSESGMGCGPEWPLCNGEVIPELSGDTLIEFTHRVIGLLLVVLEVYLYFLIRKASKGERLRTAGKWMISILTFQVLAGAVVVILDLPTVVVTTHLLTAMVFMLSLLWIYRMDYPVKAKSNISYTKQKMLVIILNILLVLILLTIGLGAYIKHMHYGLACSWLECGDSWVPETGPQLIQTLHRLVAILTTAYTILLTIFAITKKWTSYIKNRLLLASFLLLLQLLSGALTIKTSISIPWAVIHLAIGTALFMVIADARVSLTSSFIKVKTDWSSLQGKTLD
jgi:heme a synthase